RHDSLTRLTPRSRASALSFFSLLMRRPPRSTLFPYNDALPISTWSCTSASGRVRSGRYSTTCAETSWLGPVSTASVLCFFCTARSEEHTSELQSLRHLVCRLLLEKKNKKKLTVVALYLLHNVAI